MVQAIQVLRFHLLELEKVSNINLLFHQSGIHFDRPIDTGTCSEKYRLTLSEHNIVSIISGSDFEPRYGYRSRNRSRHLLF